jgi:hypothetical protein
MLKWLNMPQQHIYVSDGSYTSNTGSITLENLMKMYPQVNHIRNNLQSLYVHTRIGDSLDEYECTIVMTASNRSSQTYKTLDTISKSVSKNIQVVLVDDSKQDGIQIDKLKSYPFAIDFIQIKQDTKCWCNPVVNYNIGFQFIQGKSVVIQNAEVCHVGDVLSFVKKNVLNSNNTYFVFDVRQSANHGSNEQLYTYTDLDISVYDKHSLFEPSAWYQSAAHNNRALHFLVATDITTFRKIGGFSYDYAFGDSYDDDDFLMKIRKLGIQIISLDNTNVGCGGIHLYHSRPYETWARTIPSNNLIFQSKMQSPMYINFI